MNQRQVDEYQQLSGKQVGQYMSENLSRMIRILRNMPEAVDRWNYIMDNIPDTEWGMQMGDNLVKACSKMPGGIKRWQPEAGKSCVEILSRLKTAARS